MIDMTTLMSLSGKSLIAFRLWKAGLAGQSFGSSDMLGKKCGNNSACAEGFLLSLNLYTKGKEPRHSADHVDSLKSFLAANHSRAVTLLA